MTLIAWKNAAAKCASALVLATAMILKYVLCSSTLVSSLSLRYAAQRKEGDNVLDFSQHSLAGRKAERKDSCTAYSLLHS